MVLQQTSGSIRKGFHSFYLYLFVCAAIILALTGCTPTQRFRSAPLFPSETATKLEARTLDDPGLKAFIQKSLGRPMDWPPKAWNLRLLTLAAFYFNPQIQVARDQVTFAQAGETTARMHPNPSVGFSPGIPSPYLISVDFLVPVVTAGKRRYQIQQAQNLSEAARLNLAQTLWAVRKGVRSALLNEVVAERDLEVLRLQEQQTSQRVERIAEQVQAGELARPVLAASRLNLINTQLAEKASEGRVAQAKAALAAAIGVPLSGLGNARFAWKGLEQLPSLSTLSLQQVRRQAVLNRLDVRQALAQYQAAEAYLQLQIARQYPDFQIGPGYQYEETDNFFAPSLSLTLPIFNRNQGPIAQAEAARRQAADNLVAIQAQAIAQSEQALARYQAAYAMAQDARKALLNIRQVQEPMARSAYAHGQSDWLTLNTVLLQGTAAASAWLNAVYQAQAALGQLENVVQRPLEPQDSTPLVVPGNATNLTVRGVRP
jgi:cobalt-zinc-cadmium efflux system outer membrane protein